MKTNILKQEIETTAKETGKTEIEVISAMQATLQVLKDEKSLAILAEIKRKYIKIELDKRNLNVLKNK